MPLEWLIDLIKEWVIAQAYATVAWVEATFFTQTQVLESTIPLVVAGDPVPDSTGIYFAKGLYNGRLYYEHDHGTYFIWWDTLCTDYNLSTGLGIKAPGFWWGPANNIEGPYDWAGTYRGEAFVSEGFNYPPHGFIDRGDPAGFDWDAGDLTKDGAWHDLDVSAIVPVEARAVLIKAYLRDNLVGSSVNFRRHDNANNINTVALLTQVSVVWITADCIIPIDTDQTIEYNITAGLDSIYLSVRGWWL